MPHAHTRTRTHVSVPMSGSFGPVAGLSSSGDDMSILMRTFNARVQSVIAGGSPGSNAFSLPGASGSGTDVGLRPGVADHQLHLTAAVSTPPTAHSEAAAGSTLQNLFESRRQDVLGSAASSRGLNTQAHHLALLSDAETSSAPPSSSLQTRNTTLAPDGNSTNASTKRTGTPPAATDKGFWKAAGLRTGPPLVKVAGGWAIFFTIPFAVFAIVLVMLYVTTPTFVRKKPRNEFEVGAVSNEAVLAISGVCAGLVLVATIAWSAYVSSKSKSSIKTS